MFPLKIVTYRDCSFSITAYRKSPRQRQVCAMLSDWCIGSPLGEPKREVDNKNRGFAMSNFRLRLALVYFPKNVNQLWFMKFIRIATR